MEERRRSERLRCWLVLRLESEEQGTWLAMSRNLSETGALVATASRLEVGHPVTVTLRVDPEEDAERSLGGTIVRVEPHAEDQGGMWPHRVAIEFDKPDEELAELLRQDLESWSADYLIDLENGDEPPEDSG